MLRVLIADYKNADISAEIPYLFKKAGCEVDVYCRKGSWLLKNRSWDRWHEAASDPAEYAKGLIARVENASYDWIILTDDPVLRIMNDRIGDDSAALKILPVAKLANRNVIGSKAALSLLCEKYQLRTPPFAIYNEGDDLSALTATVGYPLLLKVDRSGGGSGVFRCIDESKLAETLRLLAPDQRKNLVFQKYIEGDNIGVDALYRKGTLLAYARSKVVRTVTDEFSISSVRSYAPDETIEPELRRIGEEIGIDGFCNFTFMQEGRTGTYYLIEADLRPHAWFSLARLGGVDFSLAIRNYLSGSNTLIGQPCAAEVEIRHFFRDFNWSVERGDWRGILMWIFNRDGRWKFVPLHDRRIFFATLGQLARNRLRSLHRLLHVSFMKRLLG
ncbi:MAG: hypothetical protein WDN10_01065 [bacterium]